MTAEGRSGAIVRCRVLVEGWVQGVFYRATAERQALAHGVSGYARNLNDGRVELVLEGTPDAVGAVVEWARIGPPRARVDRIEIFDEPPEGLRGFRAR